MAGLGFKDFQVGEVLTSSDVDGYLMQQAVMRFADSGARGSALGTAVGTGVALAEGMVSYLDDTNVVEVYTGSGWRSGGAGIGFNVVSTTKTDTFSTTSSAYVDITGLSVSITPSSSASKVLVIASVYTSRQPGNASRRNFFQLVRDSTAIAVGTAAGSRVAGTFEFLADGGAGGTDAGVVTAVFLDSPATTSATTYKMQISDGNQTGTAYVNTADNDTDASYVLRGVSTITAIEVAA